MSTSACAQIGSTAIAISDDVYCTSARIRKTVRSLIIDEAYEIRLHLVEDLSPQVVEDIWAEHWQEIMRVEFEFTPADVHPLVAKRCVTELRKMETNAKLNDTDPTTIWQHLS